MAYKVIWQCFVAKRRRKLARHAVSGHDEKGKFVLKGRWKCANEIACGCFRRPAGTGNFNLTRYQPHRVWLISGCPFGTSRGLHEFASLKNRNVCGRKFKPF